MIRMFVMGMDHMVLYLLTGFSLPTRAPELFNPSKNLFNIFMLSMNSSNAEITKEVQYKITTPTPIPQIPAGSKFSGASLIPLDYSPSLVENKFNEIFPISPKHLLMQGSTDTDQYVKVRIRKGRFLVSSWEHLSKVKLMESPISPSSDVCYKNKDEEYSSSQMFSPPQSATG
ncbi:hypothetical protein HK096_002764 [Nowakowskiella sp. JEL0078]|nr:hypothetical protein HK096_002764 [Nowakowskiella sp. JEL0078]